MNKLPLQGDISLDTQLAEITDDFLDRIGRGENPDVLEYVQDHPELADVLRQMLPALAAIHFSGSDDLSSDTVPDSEAPVIGRLGDFRLLHEIGRGGMGVVYEAEQISIGRRVALKVLPFAGVLDERQLARFKNESRAAGSLNHPHIVPVHAVGSERGVHYYAMQYVEGQSLAEVIADLRGDKDDSADVVPTDAETKPVATLSTERETDSDVFFRRVARLGIQAAEALDHAHGVGIVHRDIKPSNLMVDMAGKLLITDFGLAQIQGEGNLTMTGDLVGTLRYMSPEQADGDRAVLDHRADIYSLGITLYELLTLRPAFEGTEKAKLLRDILEHDPPAPRTINSAIPRDLETIVLKAISKDVADRYRTAGQMADDLNSFFESRPITARRPGPVECLARWTRQNKARVWMAGSFVVLLMMSSVVSSWGWIAAVAAREEANQAEQQSREQLDAIGEIIVGILNEGNGKLRSKSFEDMAIAITEKLGDPFVRFRLHSLTGRRCRFGGYFERADHFLVLAENIAKTTDGISPDGIAWNHNLRGRVRSVFRGYEGAIVHYRNSTQVENLSVYARVGMKQELAYFLAKNGEIQESRRLFGEIVDEIGPILAAGKLPGKMGNHPGDLELTLCVYITSAIRGNRKIDYAAMAKRLEERLENSTADPFFQIFTTVTYAMLQEELGDDEAAIRFYEKAVKLRRFNDPPLNEQQPTDWIELRLAQLLEKSGESGSVIATKMRRWNAVREHVLLPNHPMIAFGQIRLAKWLEQHSLPGSAKELKEAKAILEPQRFTPKHVLDEINMLIEKDSAEMPHG